MKSINKLIETQELAEAGILLAPESFIRTAPHKLIEVCNGCGAANSRYDFVPDTLVGAYVGYACFIHDWQYHVGITEEDKRQADKDFRENLLVLIKMESASLLVITLRYVLCLVYYLGVKHKGYESFWEGKNEQHK